MDPYTVIEAEPVVIRPMGGAFDPLVNHSARAIVNFGVGVEQRLSSKTTVYGSWMQDASAAVSDPELNQGVIPFAIDRCGRRVLPYGTRQRTASMFSSTGSRL